MIVALHDGKLARATSGARAVCPECRNDVYARMPDNAIRHWAHIPLADGLERECSSDAGEMSEWHRAWQWLRADEDCIEVRGDGHRADVINAGGFAVEFQHSSISPEEITKRERYWRKGLWVLDGTDSSEGKQRVGLKVKPGQPADDPYRFFTWARAPLLLYRAKWPCWIDLGEDRGLLQVRVANDGRGNGWWVSRRWFIDEVLNGRRPTLRQHVVRSPAAAGPKKRIGRARAETDADLRELVRPCHRPTPLSGAGVEPADDAWEAMLVWHASLPRGPGDLTCEDCAHPLWAPASRERGRCAACHLAHASGGRRQP